LSDPYLLPGTDVLRNKFGVLNADDLDCLVDDIATKKSDRPGLKLRPGT
jgi:hypothetical protein